MSDGRLSGLTGSAQTFFSKYWSAFSLRSLFTGSLFTNSVYILMANILSAGFGLLFWIIAARYYEPYIVGLATALISMAGIILLVSRLGVDQSMARFLPAGDRSSIYSTAIIVTSAFSVLFTVGYLLTASFWSPDFQIGWDLAVGLIALILAWSVAVTSNMALMAIRKAKASMIQTLVMGSRVGFLLVMAALGIAGIIGAFALSFILAIIFGQYVLAKGGISMKGVDWHFVRTSMRFSYGNWISGLLDNLPIYLLPILVFSYLGATQTAEFYMAYTFASIVFMVPRSFIGQMYIEGCHEAPLRGIIIKSASVSVLMVLPAIAGLYLIAPWLLGFLGSDYAENGLQLLRLLAISSILWIPYRIFYYVKMIKKDMRGLVLISLLNCTLIVGLSILFMMAYGLDGIGYAWIMGYGAIALALLPTILRTRRGQTAAHGA